MEKPQQCPHHAHASFEAGQKRMMNGVAQIEEIIDFKATITDEPLKHAFDSKVTVHSRMAGRPYMGQEARELIEGQFDNERQGTGLAYIHVPFCETRCLYCLFYQNPLQSDSSQRYTDTLIKELQLWSDKKAQQATPLHAVYFGGVRRQRWKPPTLSDWSKLFVNIYRLPTIVKLRLKVEFITFRKRKWKPLLKPVLIVFRLVCKPLMPKCAKRCAELMIVRA